MDEEAGVEVMQDERGHVVAQLGRGLQAARARRARAGRPPASWPKNVTRPSGRTPRVCGLAASCSSAAKRIAWPRVSSSESGSASRSARRVEAGGDRIALEQRDRRRAPPACGRGRRGGGSGSARSRAARAARAARRRQPVLSISSRPRSDGIGAETTRLNSAKTRSLATRSSPGALRCGRRAGGRVDLEVELDRDPDRPQAAQRVVFERLRARPSARGVARRSSRPPCGSSSSPPASGSAIALIVKSRCGEVGVDVVVAQRDQVDVPRVVGRDHPPRPERAAELERRRRARPARACARAASGRPATARSTSSVSRPSSLSRTAPPTSQASSPVERLPRDLERLAHCDVAPRHARRDPARDLVVDRAERARPVLGEDALVAARADQHRLGAALDRLSPRSTVMLSIETVPTPGTRRPPTSTSNLPVSPRRKPSP